MDTQFEISFEKFLRRNLFKKQGLDPKDKKNDVIPNPAITGRTLYVYMSSPWGDFLKKEESISLGSQRG